MDDAHRSVATDVRSGADWDRVLRRAVLPAKRDAVIALRSTGLIDDVVLRLVQERPDTEELRLRR